ncbi:hypothetical protein A2U01_0097066, partial [Trifolium medium]|nr:hypothetical protein [Trifolium medium]
MSDGGVENERKEKNYESECEVEEEVENKIVEKKSRNGKQPL